MKQLLSILLICLTLLVTGCGAAGGTGESGDSGEGRVLPDAELELLAGGNYELRQTGRPRALNLWATWCVPCRAELPAFDDVASRVEGVDIVGINVGDDGDDALELVEELGLTFTQVLDPSATVQQSLRITGMPATVFVDADGEILEIHSGELETAELESLLSDLFDATFES